MKTIAALMSAACLCAPVAAQVQTQSATAPATASKTNLPSAAQPGGKLTRIAGAPGANLQALSGDSEGCPRGPNGEEECTVEVSGSSSMGGFGGGSLGGGGSGGMGGPQSCGSSKVLQAVPCTPDTSGGTGPSDQEKLKTMEQCDANERKQKALLDERYAKLQQQCVRDNPDSSGSVSLGVTVQGTGASFSLPADWFTSPAAKRQKCEAEAKEDRDTEVKLTEARANSCRVKAANGN